VLDPKSPVDVFDWNWLQHNKEIAENIDEAKSNESQCLFYIDDPGREVRKRKEASDRKFEAQRIIRDLQQSEKVDMMRYLGMPSPVGLHEDDIDDMLIQQAEKDPQSIISAYKDESKKDKLFIHALVDARKIKKDGYGSYRIGDMLIGRNLEGAVLWLRDGQNRDIVVRLFQELKERNPRLEKISVVEELEAETRKNIENGKFFEEDKGEDKE
jgi:hypothetical protein